MRPRLGLSESGRSRALRVPRVASRTVRAMPFPLADFAYFLSIIRDRITPDVGGHSTRCPLKNLGFSASGDIRRRPDYKLSGENRGSSPLGSANNFNDLSEVQRAYTRADQRSTQDRGLWEGRERRA
jgi:hypothetical protein